MKINVITPEEMFSPINLSIVNLWLKSSSFVPILSYIYMYGSGSNTDPDPQYL